MPRRRNRHPLQSFQFWFLVLSCIGATSAWRMGWLPGSTEKEEAAPEVALESDLGAPLFGTDAPFTREPAIADGQYEPSATGSTAALRPEASSVAAVPTKPQESPFYQERPAPAAAPVPQTPFGPRELEFHSADVGSQPQYFTQGGIQPRPTPSADMPSGIQQVSAVEAAVVDPSTARIQNAFNAQFAPGGDKGIDWSEIDQMITVGQDVEAHRKLSTLYWEQPALREQVLPRIQQTARRIYFQPQPHYLDPYVIEPGDVLQNVAKQYNLSWQYLAKLNRLDPQRIRPGQSVKVMQGPFGAVVDLRRFELTVESFGYYVAHFPIGIGKDGSSPVGEFTVQDKLEDPTYYGPDGVIANDNPNNPLGEFWLSLGNSYGLHGTNDESTIGRAESRGCIRLRNQDVADLYDLLTIGSKVVIRR